MPVCIAPPFLFHTAHTAVQHVTSNHTHPTDINEKVLHYLLKLPPALEIQSVVCDAMVISVPWLRLSTDPLTVDITNIKVVVAEIDHETEQYKRIPEVDFLLELILFVTHHQQQQQVMTTMMMMTHTHT